MLGGGNQANNIPSQDNGKSIEDTSQDISKDLDDDIPF